MTKPKSDQHKRHAVQTTGHAWDGDIQEYNNPLPRWWVWAFYATVVFALIYWVIYPAWPVGDTYTKGVLNKVSYEVDGQEKTTHWNTRARLLHNMTASDAAQRRQQYIEKVAAADYETIRSDPEMMAFTRSMAKGLFGDNCMPCHGAGGTGKVGYYPNLADDAWLWGGTLEEIRQTITHGHRGFMPGFAETFNEEQLAAVASFVLSLSGHEVDAGQAGRGAEIFRGETGGCYYCHTKAGTGRASQGAADLTDRIWTVANVPGRETLEGKMAEVKAVIRNGVTREMPAWDERLSDAEIKLLTLYVHDVLGGGQ